MEAREEEAEPAEDGTAASAAIREGALVGLGAVYGPLREDEEDVTTSANAGRAAPRLAQYEDGRSMAAGANKPVGCRLGAIMLWEHTWNHIWTFGSQQQKQTRNQTVKACERPVAYALGR